MAKSSSEKSVLGRRLREARRRFGIAQDKLGVLIGLDEGSSSARMSRYESGVHEPPFILVKKIAGLLAIPPAYFYCEDDELAEMILLFPTLKSDDRKKVMGMLRSATGGVVASKAHSRLSKFSGGRGQK